MSGHRKFSELREQVLAEVGGAEAVAEARAEALEEVRLYELRHAEALSQVEVAGRLEITQSAVSKLEHAEDVRVSTLRDYLDAMGLVSSWSRYSMRTASVAYRYTLVANPQLEPSRPQMTTLRRRYLATGQPGA